MRSSRRISRRRGPGAVIVYRRDLSRLAPALAGVPHETIECGDPGQRSHDYVLVWNRSGR